MWSPGSFSKISLDVIRVIGKSKEFITYWVESEPGIGLSLKESTTFNSNNDLRLTLCYCSHVSIQK